MPKYEWIKKAENKDNILIDSKSLVNFVIMFFIIGRISYKRHQNTQKHAIAYYYRYLWGFVNPICLKTGEECAM